MTKFKCRYIKAWVPKNGLRVKGYKVFVTCHDGDKMAWQLVLRKDFNQKLCIKTYCALIKILKRRYNV